MAQIGRKTTQLPEEEKIGGIGVYRDDKGRPVYWNRFNKTAYVLTGKTKPFRKAEFCFSEGSPLKIWRWR